MKNHLTHEYIKGVKGELLLASDSTRIDSVHTEYHEDKEAEWTYAYFTASVREPGSYLVRLWCEGYQTQYVPFEVKKLYKRERYRRLKTVYMRPLIKSADAFDGELDEVTVRATKLKFYMDGDTLVYNADAFNLSEGSMLDALLKRLPGVELEQGGVIKVNGRKVNSLLLNGKDFFDSDRELLLENMPTYMVKEVRSYERVPDEVKGTAREKTTQKELVMDVRLKKDYNTGWMANADVGGGLAFRKSDGEMETDRSRYLGRLFGLRFSDRSRLVLFANANNLNDYRVPGEKGEWSPLTQSQGLTSRVTTGGNFRIEKEDLWQYEGSVNGTYTDSEDATNTSSATFLDDCNTYGRSFSDQRNRTWEVNTNHRFFGGRRDMTNNWLKRFRLRYDPSFQYQKWRNHNESASATLSEDVASHLGKDWLDSISSPRAGDLLRRYAINRTLSKKKGDGHWYNWDNDGNLSLTPAHNDYVDAALNYSFQMTERRQDSYMHYLLDFPANESQASDFRNRYDPTLDRTRNAHLRPSVDFRLGEGHHAFGIAYDYFYSHNSNNHPLYLLNKLSDWADPESHALGTLPSVEEMLATLDAGNSSNQTSTTHQHEPMLQYRYGHQGKKNKNAYTLFDNSLSLRVGNERLDYHRGTQIDTLMTRRTVYPQINTYFYHGDFERGRSFVANYVMTIEAPSLTNLLDVRDDANPLYITLGNPNLRSTRNHHFSSNYEDKYGKTLFHANINAALTERAVTAGFIYDKKTGVRTVTLDNINGNWMLSASSGINFPLMKNDRLRLKQDLSYSHHHSVDLSGTNESLVASRSVVDSHNLSEDLRLTWSPDDKLEFALNGSLEYQRSIGQSKAFQDINAFTYNYGLRAQVELPWDFQLSTDLTMYSRRGYSLPSMNTDEFVWNARLAKRFTHARSPWAKNLTILFDGFDLLGQLSNISRTINAQGRTETFYNVIPSYGILHLLWHLNRKPREQKRTNP